MAYKIEQKIYNIVVAISSIIQKMAAIDRVLITFTKWKSIRKNKIRLEFYLNILDFLNAPKVEFFLTQSEKK